MFDEQEQWDQADEVRKETSGGAFVKLADGKSALLVFPSAPHAYRQVWTGSSSEMYDPDKHDGMRPTGRFAFACFELAESGQEYTAKIFDASGETYDAIKKGRKKYGARTLFEVTRSGDGLKTKYSVLFERALSDDEVEYIKSLEPLDAEAIMSGGGSSSESDEDDAPAPPPPSAKSPWNKK